MVRIYNFGIILLVLISITDNKIFSQVSNTIVVANKTGETVTTVYVSQTGTNSWGISINTKDKLLSGEVFQYTIQIENTKCMYDLKFTGENGKDYKMLNIDLCSGGTVILSKTEEKSIETEKEKQRGNEILK